MIENFVFPQPPRDIWLILACDSNGNPIGTVYLDRDYFETEVAAKEAYASLSSEERAGKRIYRSTVIIGK